MAVTLTSTPITNACAFDIDFGLGQAKVASLSGMNSDVLTIIFDRIALHGFRPSQPPFLFVQDPAANITLNPNDVAYVSVRDNHIWLQYAAPLHAPGDGPPAMESSIKFSRVA